MIGVEIIVDAAFYTFANTFPSDEGIVFADTLMQICPDLSNLTVDLRRVSAKMLISAFFYSFLERTHEVCPDLLDNAKKIRWQVISPFQQQNIARWMDDFSGIGEVVSR